MSNKSECMTLCKEIVTAEIMSFIGVNLDTKRIKDTIVNESLKCAVFLAIKTVVLNI